MENLPNIHISTRYTAVEDDKDLRLNNTLIISQIQGSCVLRCA